ncbi:uncharacterized protein [Anoplolepis gracilipes]|uniref:uncharacterized protein n=1 Tax=Anoplolepis gracilipes TaxID=354296 RepID=UPI003B9E9ABE
MWERAKVVLLHKGGKEEDDPTAYRPICLLDEVGKIYERILVRRLVQHLARDEVPFLHEEQYGSVRADLRKFEPTLVTVGSNTGTKMAGVTPVTCTARFNRAQCWTHYCGTSGTTRSSIPLCPSTAGSSGTPMIPWPLGSRPPPPVYKWTVLLSHKIKYLGFHIDDRWSFAGHFDRLASRAEKAAVAISRLLPNLGGPDGRVRRVYAHTVLSILMYAAPVWASEAMATRRIQHAMRRVQRMDRSAARAPPDIRGEDNIGRLALSSGMAGQGMRQQHI